jgi:hypothetical protein
MIDNHSHATGTPTGHIDWTVEAEDLELNNDEWDSLMTDLRREFSDEPLFTYPTDGIRETIV